MSWSFEQTVALAREIQSWVTDKDDASNRQADLIAQLMRGNRHERRRGEALARCKRGRRCRCGDCFECRHDQRRDILSQVGALLLREVKARPGAKLVLISAVDHRDERGRGELASFDYRKMLLRFCAQGKRVGLNFGMACADDCYSRGFQLTPVWQPHVHGLFVTTLTVEAIRKGLERSFPKAPGVNNSVDVAIVKDHDEIPAVVTYCFKLETTERNPWIGHYLTNKRWRRRRPNPRAWQRRERAMALSGVSVGDLIILMGMRRWTKDGATTVKRVHSPE